MTMTQEKASKHTTTKGSTNNWFRHNLVMNSKVQVPGNRMEKRKKSKLAKKQILHFKALQ